MTDKSLGLRVKSSPFLHRKKSIDDDYEYYDPKVGDHVKTPMGTGVVVKINVGPTMKAYVKLDADGRVVDLRPSRLDKIKSLPGYGKKDGAPPPAPKPAAPKPQGQQPKQAGGQGFTGKIEDSLGRNRCYRQGQQVPCNNLDENESQNTQKEGEGDANVSDHEHKNPDTEHNDAPEGERIVPAPCCLYTPDPTQPNPETGIPESRIGVPAMQVPPPPGEIPRLPNLTEREREAEARFADAYLDNPDHYIKTYKNKRNHVIGYSVKSTPDAVEEIAKKAQAAGLKVKLDKDKKGNLTGKLSLSATAHEVETGEEPKLGSFLKENSLKGSPAYEIGDAPNIFNTDDAKLMSPDYNPSGVDEDTVKNARGVFNLAVHQTANAMAKRAFVDFLNSDEFKNLPEEKRFVLVTSGGVAAGKGYALSQSPETAALQQMAGAVWDAAGEQNAAENPWILAECRKHGVKAKFAFIHANPIQTWENPDRGVVQRANNIGRMVDARVFADSYAHGAKNFKRFMDENIDAEDCEFHLINNATGGQPEAMSSFPEESLSVDPEALYARAVKVLEERAGQLRPAVVRGGSIGTRVWGKPKAGEKSLIYKRSKVLYSGMRYKAMEGQEKDPIVEALLKNIHWNNEHGHEEDMERFERSLQVKPIEAKAKDDAQEDDKEEKKMGLSVKASPFKKKSLDNLRKVDEYKGFILKYDKEQEIWYIFDPKGNNLGSTDKAYWKVLVDDHLKGKKKS